MATKRNAFGVPVVVAVLLAALWVSGCFGGSDHKATHVPRTVGEVIVLRGGRDVQHGTSVLLLRHGPQDFFSPGNWEIPGGAAAVGDSGDQAARRAAVIGLATQARVRLDPANLVPYAQWIVPGFDTRFYLALAPAHSVPRPDGSSIVHGGWYAPARALTLRGAGKLPLGYSTLKQLESLTRFSSSTDALEYARGHSVTPVHLRIVGSGKNRQAVLPGDSPQG